MEAIPPGARAQLVHNSCRESELDIDHFEAGVHAPSAASTPGYTYVPNQYHTHTQTCSLVTDRAHKTARYLCF